MAVKLTCSSDYARLEIDGAFDFYYGYEETKQVGVDPTYDEPIEEWCFTVRENGNGNLLNKFTTSEIRSMTNLDKDASCKDHLLIGMSVLLAVILDETTK